MTPPIKPGEREAIEAPPPKVNRGGNGHGQTETVAAAAPNKARKAFLMLGAVVGVALLATAAWFFATRNQVATDDAQIESDVVPVAAQTGGRVAEVLVQANQSVKKGDVLFRIDDADHAARLKQAQAQLAVAQAQEQIAAASAQGGLSSARAGVTGSTQGVQSAQAQVAAARAALDRAQSEARKAELDLARTKQLHDAGALAQESLDEDQLKFTSAQAAVSQAQAALTSAEQQKAVAQAHVGEAQGRLAASTPVDAQVAVAHAQTELAEAAVTLAQNQLDYTRVTAPADGVVSSFTVRAGQLINAGQPVGELVPSTIYVVANYKETQIGDMRPGDRATISVDAFPGHDLEGKVESLSAGTGARFSLLPPDNASGNFVKVVQRVPVRIALTGAPGDVRLAAGLSANVTVYTR